MAKEYEYILVGIWIFSAIIMFEQEKTCPHNPVL